MYEVMTVIKIMGIPFKIVEKPVVCKGEVGLTRGVIDFTNDTIEIDSELSIERKDQTVIHEILHAILDMIGEQELSQNERLVQNLSAAIYCLIKENDIVFKTKGIKENTDVED